MLALKKAGFSLVEVQSDVLLPTCLHVTAFSIDQRWRFVIPMCMSMRRYTSSRWSQRLVSQTGVCTMYTRFCISLKFCIANRTVWRIQIWRDKVRCFLLKELDCFMSIVWRQKASFPSKIFKWEWRDKDKLNMHIILKMSWCCLPKNYKNQNLAIANTIRRGHIRPKYYTVILKSRLRITQGHWKRNHWTDHTRLTMGRLKMREWKMRHWHNCRGGKCRSGKCGSRLHGWKMQE